MESPFFSIIMPAYNRASILGKAVTSILSQTYTNWELLIVDDGSTDNTKEVVQSYTDPRIKYIYQKNAERSAARNNGIANAAGRYITFIDSDDYFLPAHLQGFYNELEKRNFPVCMLFGYNVMDVDGVQRNEEVEYVESQYNTIEEYMLLHPVRVAAACVERSILAEENFDDTMRVGEDTELWMRIAAKYPIFSIKAYTQAYVIHGGQTVNDNNTRIFKEHIASVKKIAAFDNKLKRISGNTRSTALAYAYFRLAQSELLNKKKSAALAATIASVYHKPGNRLKEKIVLLLASLGLKKYYQ